MFTLGRKIDINYPTNRLIVILSLIVTVIGWGITGEILSGLSMGGGTFLTWALTREVDPSHEYSAFLCVALSLLNLFYYERIQLLVIFWILLMMRLVNGMTGKSLTPLDIFSVLGMTLYLSLTSQNSIYLLPFIVAMALVLIFEKKKTLALIGGGISLLAFITQSFVLNHLSLSPMAISKPVNIAVIILMVASFIVWVFLSKNQVKDDFGNIINRAKILSSQVIFSLILISTYLFGDMAINNLIIYLSVIIGVVVFWIGYSLMAKKTSHTN